jgi:hypothetical protein
MSLVARILLTGSLALSTAGLLLAQHSGGHGGGGGFGRGAAASGYGGQAFAAPPIGTMNAVPPGSSSRFSAPSIGTMNAVPPGRARLGYGGGYSYGRGYGYNNRNRNYPLAYWFTPYYYPGLFYDSGPLFDYYDNYPYPVGDVPQGPDAQQQDLAQNMPPQYAPYPPYYYPPEPYAMPPQGAYTAPPPGYYNNPPYAVYPPAAPQTSDMQPSPPVTLVLTNGEKLQVQNYAIMGSTFWDFSKQPARRIPLSSIDVPASTKATEANGAEFPPIS